jgi:hypothetical protein
MAACFPDRILLSRFLPKSELGFEDFLASLILVRFFSVYGSGCSSPHTQGQGVWGVGCGAFTALSAR